MKYLLPDKKFLQVYLLIFFLSTLVWSVVVQWQTNPGWKLAAADACISMFLLFLFMMPVWYVVRFAKPAPGIWRNGMLNILIADLLLLSAWFFVAQYFIWHVSINMEEYQEFLKDTRLIRAMAGFLMAMIISLGFIVFHLFSETSAAADRELKLQNMIQKIELQALKNQLNPHFIYNSLNAISSLTTTQPEKARKMIIQLSDFLRFALKQDATELITLRRELEAINLYLQIEKIRFGEKLNVQFDVDEDLLDVRLPVMLLQPLFENAIKHGIQVSSVEGNILFSARHAGTDMLIALSNPYDSAFHRFRSEGVGLENIRNRLRVIYGNGKLLQVVANKNTFVATLSLPQKR